MPAPVPLAEAEQAPTGLETTDAIELAELLQFIANWLDGYLGLLSELSGQPLEGR